MTVLFYALFFIASYYNQYVHILKQVDITTAKLLEVWLQDNFPL